VHLVKTILIPILIIANLASSWLVPLIYVDFELREEYIGKVLCIEKDKTITSCNGSCYLSEQLGKAAEQQEKDQQMNPVEIVFFFQQTVLDFSNGSSNPIIEISYLDFVDQNPLSPYPTDIFRPPRS